MRPACKFYLNSECTNPRCRYAHPVEFPMYIYSQPGIEIHPDELRYSVAQSDEMAAEADRVWVNNYVIFCRMRSDEGGVDIVSSPDYFCMPFNVQEVTSQVKSLRNSGQLEPAAQAHGPRPAEQKSWGASWNPANSGQQPYGRGRRRPYGGQDSSASGSWHRQNSGHSNSTYHERDRGGSWSDSSRDRGGDRSYGHGGSWFGNGRDNRGNQHSAAYTLEAEKSGSFERRFTGNATNPDTQSNSPEYDYRNVPYDRYK